MLLPGKRFIHIVRYGTAADQKFISGPLKDAYDVLTINANIVAHTPSAIQKFLKEKIPGKEYFIDPQTHAFQHGISYLQKKPNDSASDIKTSLRKLAEAYGEPFNKILGKAHFIKPQDVLTNLNGFCQRVIDFQKSHIEVNSKKGKIDKYADFLEEEGITLKSLGPLFIVSPYFYLTPDNYEEWSDVNIECFKKTRALVKEGKVAFELVISQEMLSSILISDFIKKLNSLKVKPDVILLWIDDFKEHEATEGDLTDYIDLCNELSGICPVINLYGSFFSIVVGRNKIIKNLYGVGHGPEYGESRPVVPVGGGLPVSKFYLPNLHSRLKFRDAVQAIMDLGAWKKKEKFHGLVCDCKQCDLLIKTSPEKDFEAYGRNTVKVTHSPKTGARTRSYPTSESRGVCVRHYMLVKQNEYTSKSLIDLSAVITNLQSSAETFEGSLDDEVVGHCLEWSNALNNYI